MKKPVPHEVSQSMIFIFEPPIPSTARKTQSTACIWHANCLCAQNKLACQLQAVNWVFLAVKETWWLVEIRSAAWLGGSNKAQSPFILRNSSDGSINLVSDLFFWQKTLMKSLSLTALSSIAKVEFHLCRHWQSCLASTQVLLLLFLERMLISGVNANRNWFDC